MFFYFFIVKFLDGSKGPIKIKKSASLEELDISSDLYKFFEKAGLETVGDLIKAYHKNPKFLMEYGGFGKMRQKQLDDMMNPNLHRFCFIE